MAILSNQELENIRRSLPATTTGAGAVQQFAGTVSPMQADTAESARTGGKTGLVPQGYDAQGNRLPTPPPPTPLTTPTGTTLTPTPTRYAPKTSAEIDAGLASERAQLAAEQEKRRVETLNRINAKYDTQSKELMAQQRAINYNRGQIGAETGYAAKNKVAKAVEGARTDEINTALASLDDLFYKRGRELTADAYTKAQYDMTTAQNIREVEKADRESAKEKLAVLGSGNATVETIRQSDPQTYSNLQNLGFGDVEIDAYLTAGRTEENKVKVTETYEQAPDGTATLVRTKFDPVTGKMTRVTQSMGIPFAALATHKPAYRDGQYYDEVTNADGTITMTPIGELSTQQKLQNELLRAQIDATRAKVGGAGGAVGNAPSGYRVEATDRTLAQVDEALNAVSGWNTGWGSLLGVLPSTDATNFNAMLDTIKANIGFNELTAMREASKTGGALGAISDRELTLLTSVLGSLNVKQSPSVLKQNLQDIKDSLKRWKEAVGGDTTQENTPRSGMKLAPVGGTAGSTDALLGQFGL